MTETRIDIPIDPYPGEYWTQTPHVRWATMYAVANALPVLQVMWQSSYGRQSWRAVETVAVGQNEYEQK